LGGHLLLAALPPELAGPEWGNGDAGTTVGTNTCRDAPIPPMGMGKKMNPPLHLGGGNPFDHGCGKFFFLIPGDQLEWNRFPLLIPHAQPHPLPPRALGASCNGPAKSRGAWPKDRKSVG